MPIAPVLQQTIADRLKSRGIENHFPLNDVLWQGPCNPGPLGGISQSMLSSFLECRERFRQRYLEGWYPIDKFNHTIEFGQMFHIAEEMNGNGQPWQEPVHAYAANLCQKYPLSQEEINKYHQALLVQYPIYLDYWAKHEAPGEDAVVVFREKVFHEEYVLPSGRSVWLRGKGDGADSVSIWGNIKYDTRALILHENKTKSEIRREIIEQRLAFDLQTALYLVCLQKLYPDQQVVGVRYNVIRRPFSSGKGCIKKAEGKMLKSGWKEGESQEDFNARLQQYFIEEPETWFARWSITVTQGDLDNFRHKFLNPLLEQLCDWYNFVTSQVGIKDPFQDSLHWQTPFGLWNSLRDGSGTTDYDELLLNGSSVGLERATSLFRELV